MTSIGEFDEANATLTDQDAFSGNDTSMCSIGPDPVSEACRYWIQGVLLSFVGVVGFLGNSVSLKVNHWQTISHWHVTNGRPRNAA